MAIDVKEYEDLDGMSPYDGGGKEPVDPEDDFFHSVYIGGNPRTTTLKSGKVVSEESGKFHIRGVEYNLTEVNGIITHVKPVMVNNTWNQSTKKEAMTCFSYMNTDPMKGTSGRVCGKNRAERAADPFCSTCRSHLIVGLVYCDANGNPIVNPTGNISFIFLRGKGMKYENIFNYLNELASLNPSEIGSGALTTNPEFEKKNVNHKRFVTNITKGNALTQKGGNVNVFVLNKGILLKDKIVEDIMKLSKKTLDKFNEKFDWTKTQTSKKPSSTSGFEQLPDADSSKKPEEQASANSSASGFDFSGVSF